MARHPRRRQDSGEQFFLRLLFLYPPDFRRRFGDEMTDLFRVRRHAARTPVGTLWFWSSLIADALHSSIRERLPAGRPIVEPLKQDVRHAWRGVRGTPVFSAFVIGLTALCVGVATAMFTIVNAVLLRPLPFKEADRLVVVWEQRHAVARNNVAGHEFPEWKERSATIEIMAAIAFDRDFSLTGAGDPLALRGVRVTSDFFRVLGVPPAAGQVFGPEADQPGQGEVAVISHRLWTERFGADPALPGRTIQLNDRPYRVMAVMPVDFKFPPDGAGEPPDVWTPIAEPIHRYVGRHYLSVIGRLAEGATPAQAQTELASIAESIGRNFPPNRHHGVNVQSLESELVTSVRTAILVLFAAVIVVLLVGCCNVGNLLLGRANDRQQEVAIRTALGAGRWRLTRQLLAEAAMLAGAGAALGLLLASWLVSLAVTAAPPGVPRLEAASIDPLAIAFTAGVALAATFVFGLLPVARYSRLRVADRLKSGTKGIASPSRHPLRGALIVAEVALTVALSICAALLGQSFIRLAGVDPGFDAEGVTAVSLTLPAARYPGPERLRAFYTEAMARLTALPGVSAVAATHMVPHGGGVSGIGISVEGRPLAAPGEEPAARYRVVSSGYFETLGVPVLHGRTFGPGDARVALPLIRWFEQQPHPPGSGESQAAPAAVINETMARQIWPGEEAVGRRFRVLFSPPITVVGIVADTRNAALSDVPVAEFYLSDLQEPQARMTLLIRGAGGAAVLPAAAGQIAALDPALPVVSARALNAVIDGNLVLHRFMSSLMGGFAGVALLLMIAGIYGVISYATAQRRHEIGVRMALGATRVDIWRLVVFGSLVFSAAGMVMGIAGGYALGRVSQDLLFEIGPADPATYLTLVITVLVVALMASWVPARRAMRVDPASVLRNE
jgi:putative ABC transport system permease protein